MAKPRIGITMNQFVTESGILTGLKRQYVSDAYIQSVLRAGGVPVLLPIIEGKEAIKEQAAMIDGLLLSGGGDVQPQLFGEEPERQTGTVLPERDAHELALVKLAMVASKPILGICRGCQVLTIALGGSIYQHLSPELAVIQHEQQSLGSYAGHTVELADNSKLAKLWGNYVMTNSFHHQAVKVAASGFSITGRTKDGVIEAVEHETAPFVIGVQWHPELMVDNHPKMLQLFSAFVKAAKWK